MQKEYIPVTHQRPHLDEIVAIWQLRKWGDKKFLGIAKAQLVTWSEGNESPDGRSLDEWEKDGFIVIGAGGKGRFNHHPHKEYGEVCSATLVAKYLEIDDDPALTQILAYTLKSDLGKSDGVMDLASCVKYLNTQYPDNPEKVLDWVFEILNAKYSEQQVFFNSTKKKFENAAKILTVQMGKKELRIVSIHSNNELMSKFARSKHGGRANVVIQQHSSGNVQIFTSMYPPIKLTDVACVLRVEEQCAKGVFTTKDFKELGGEGKTKGVEEWYYQKEGEMLLNGSLTATDVPPTRLSLEKIEELVALALESSFPPECPDKSCTREKCELYKYGFQRCRRKRYQLYSSNSN